MFSWMLQKKVRQRIVCIALAALCISIMPGGLSLAKSNAAVSVSDSDAEHQNTADKEETGTGKEEIPGDAGPAAVSMGDAPSYYAELSKDSWTQGEDGKWRKLVDVPGWDIGGLTEAPVIGGDTAECGIFYNGGPGGNPTAELTDINGVRNLKISYADAAAHNLKFRIDFNVIEPDAAAYEVRFRYTVNGGNGQLAVQNNNNPINIGKVLDAEGNVLIENQELNYNLFSAAVKQGTIIFDKSSIGPSVNVMNIKLFSPAATTAVNIEKLELVAVSETDPEQTGSLSKDKWTLCEDGLWRIIVDVPGMDIGALPEGSYEVAPNPGSSKLLNQFYFTGPNSAMPSAEAGADGLKFTWGVGDNKAHNLFFKADLSKMEPGLSFELSCKVKKLYGANTSISVQNGILGNTQAMPGKVNGVDAASMSYSLTGGADFQEAVFSFTREALTSGNMDIKIWAGPPAAGNQLIIERLELVAVSDKEPGNYTDKEALIRANDMITPKNGGDFEAVSGNDAFWTGADSNFSRTGAVDLTSEDKNKGNQSAKLEAGSELQVNVDGLEADTEYTIFFAAKVGEKGGSNRMEFRLSGFRDKDKLDYDNGNYNNGDGGKNWSEAERSNMYNWLENLKITEDRWSSFRYDFTTGGNAENAVRARFTATGSAVYVDDIYLVKKSELKETSYTLPGNDQLSRGNRILIDQGLQIMSWITTDTWEKEKGWIKQPSLEQIEDLGLTAVQYNDKPNFSLALHQQAESEGKTLKWSTAWGPKYNHISGAYQDSGDGKTGAPTEEEWENGYLTEEMGAGYVKDLVSMCIGDEDDYSDTLTQNVKSWFEMIREKYDNAQGRTTDILLHHNEVGNSPQGNLKQISTFNKDMLRKYVRTAKPDMITYDMYYFREKRLDQTKGGTVIPFYDDLNRYRIVAGEGLDGSGEQPIPFGLYTYSWRTGPGAASYFKRGDGYYEMTESQINLYTFAPWAFGAKWLSNFRWLDDNPSYLFSDYRQNPDGSTNQYYIYDQFKEMIRQSKNLGPHLVRLNNLDVAIVRGQQKTADGTVKTNDKPADNPDWSDVRDGAMNAGVHISDIQAENLGTQNDGLTGDVFVSYFELLPNLTEADKKVFTSADPKYFMLLNGLTAGDGLPAELQHGSSYETRQQITVTFSNIPQGAKLKKVSRVHDGTPGDVVDVTLVDGNKLVTVIGGGYADLYYWEEGAAVADTTTGIADESGREALSVGDQKYVKEVDTMDLHGREMVIGHITGTDDMAPEANMGANINTPRVEDQKDGTVIDLNNYDTPAGNIGAIGARYYRMDIWNMRVADIEERNNVKLTFKEYNWSKETLLQKLRDIKEGRTVEDMPDLLVVPNEWLWEMDGLLDNNAVYAMQDFQRADGSQIFELDARKWNDAYEAMTTRDGKTYSSIADPSVDAVGMFVSRTLLPKVGSESFNQNGGGIYNLQKADKWTFDELDKIIEGAIANKANLEGIYLFADNEYLVRQLLVSAGVPQDPELFDARSAEFQRAMEIYAKLRDNGLLMSGTQEEFQKAFQEKKLIFYVAPYTEAAQKFAASYLYYEDNAKPQNYNLGGVFGQQKYMGPDPGVNWQVTVRVRPAGSYTMAPDDWNFMLFPKAELEDNYRAILYQPSYPVLLKGVEEPLEVAFVWNQLAKEYEGVNTLDSVTKRGGAEYPDGRVFEGATGDKNARDLDTLRKIALRDACGDNLKASGVWDGALKAAIAADAADLDGINTAVETYLAENRTQNPIYPPEEMTEEERIQQALDRLEAVKDGDYEEKEKAAADVIKDIIANIDPSGKDTEEALNSLMDALAAVEEKIRELTGLSVEIQEGNNVPSLWVENAIFSSLGADGDIARVIIKVILDSGWSDTGMILEDGKKLEHASAYDFRLLVRDDTGERERQLTMPVRITMQVPEGIDTGKEIVILHCLADGTVKELGRYQADGQNNITYMADGFSTYVIANAVEKDKPTEEPDNPSQEPDNPSQEPDNPSQEPDNPSQEPDNPSQEPDNPSQEPDHNNPGDQDSGNENGNDSAGDTTDGKTINESTKKSPATYDNSPFFADGGVGKDAGAIGREASAERAAGPAKGSAMLPLMILLLIAAAAIGGFALYRNKKER